MRRTPRAARVPFEAPLLFAIVATLGAAGSAQAAVSASEADRLANAAQVVRDINETIPSDLWTKARCVAVIPNVKKAAFMFGGEYGKGVMSCRAGERWSAPVFLQLAKGSWGFQIGAEQVDLVLLVMNESGVEKLLRDKVSLGADASIAAGPVGRHGHVGTDAQLTAEILSYSRAQGLFAGIDLSGGVLRPDADANRDAYGDAATSRTILATTSVSAPTAAAGFLNALTAQSMTTAATTNGTASPQGSGAARPTEAAGISDAELRARIADLRATLDRLLDNATPAPVGTSGSPEAPAARAGTSGATTVIVERSQLLQLRQQLDALLVALDRRR